MNIKKKIGLFYIYIFILLNACGYQPIYSKKELNFNIDSISFVSLDLQVNKILNQKLKKYINSDDNSISYNLTIDAKKSLNVVSRDSKGQAQTYKAEVTVSLTAKNDNQVIKKDFIMSNNYNSESSVTRLKEIENKIINNLSSIIADQIVLFLMNE
ncbi:MAG: hypothetical protein EVA75_00045 [Candidatus Pelagibacterales bacterium]|nr:MAG: hypothetical protein EVA75_00045 [Pelagibacterales bacterium]|tara:strand:+ start:6922 stop:7389 length:468 start_codon:yes stop_codon:yes gene_type:complete